MIFFICDHCKKRPATRLCDAAVGRSHYIGHPPRYLMEQAKKYEYAWVKVEMDKIITCDRPICEICATRVAADVDYCPTCMERIRSTPTWYKR